MLNIWCGSGAFLWVLKFQVKLYVGLYHGSEVLGDVQITPESPVVNGNCSLDETLTFGLEVKDMQPASRLCFTLHGRMRGAKVSKHLGVAVFSTLRANY